MPRSGCEFTVQGERHLGRDEGRLPRNPMIENQIKVTAFRSQHARSHVDPRGAEHPQAASDMGGIRIFYSDDDAPDTPIR